MRSLRSNLAFVGKRAASAAAAGLVATLLLGVPQASLAVPPEINYQAYLTDATGNPITSSSVQVTVNVFDASVAGTLLQSDTYLVDLSASRGFINVNVPDASTFANFVDTWVEVTVEDLIAGTPAETLLPRQKLVSAPYAIHAGTAGLLDGLDSTDLATTDSLAAHEALTGVGAHIPAAGITDAEIDSISASSVSDFDAAVSANADVTANTAARHASGSDNQDLFATVTGNVGSTTADAQLDTLSIVGGSNVSTTVAGDTLTINVLGASLDADTLDGLDSTDFATTDSLAAHEALTGVGAHIPAAGITDAEIDSITASSVSDFDASVSANADVTANTADRHASGSDNQNLFATFGSDAGNTTADAETDTLTVSGGANIDTSIIGDVLTIAVNATGLDADTLDGLDSADFAGAAALTAHEALTGVGAHIPAAGITDAEIDSITASSVSDFDASVSANADVTANTADRHASGSDNQNLYATVTGDAGTTTADAESDSLAVVGGANITTTVSADQVSIAVDSTNLDADTLDSIDSTSFLRSDAADTATGEIDFQAGIEVETIQNLAGTDAVTIDNASADVTIPNGLTVSQSATVSGPGSSVGSAANATQLTISGVATGAAANATTDRELIVVGDARIDGDLKMGVGSMHLGFDGSDGYINTSSGSGENIVIAPDGGVLSVTGRVSVSDATAPDAANLISRSYYESTVKSAILDGDGHLPDNSVDADTVVDDSLTAGDIANRTRTVFIPSGAFFTREAATTGNPNFNAPTTASRFQLVEMGDGVDSTLSGQFQLPADFGGSNTSDLTITYHFHALAVGTVNVDTYFDKIQSITANNDDMEWRYNINGNDPGNAGDSAHTSPSLGANTATSISIPAAGDIFFNNQGAAAGDVFYLNIRRNGGSPDDGNASSIYLAGVTISYPADM